MHEITREDYIKILAKSANEDLRTIKKKGNLIIANTKYGNLLCHFDGEFYSANSFNGTKYFLSKVNRITMKEFLMDGYIVELQDTVVKDKI